MKKYAVFAFMGIVCAGCIRFIFAPSAEEKAGQEAQRGFNTEIPDPKSAGIVGDKAAAYEQEQMKQKQVERMRSLEDFSSLPGESDPRQADDLALLTHEPTHTRTSGGISPRQTAAQNSVDAYRNVNRTLGNFYEKPREDPEKEKLKPEMEELKLRMDESENRKRTADEQPALLEKSFQMAAGYLPATNDLLFFHLALKNKSAVSFDAEYVVFKIVDKKVAKRTAIREQVIVPLRSYNRAASVAGGREERTVFALPRFTAGFSAANTWKSVTPTRIRTCRRRSLPSRAATMRSSFPMPEKRFSSPWALPLRRVTNR